MFYLMDRSNFGMLMKNSKVNKTAHTSNSKIGMGDYYGVGVKNPVAKIVVDQINEVVPKSKMKKPPKSLA